MYSDYYYLSVLSLIILLITILEKTLYPIVLVSFQNVYLYFDIPSQIKFNIYLLYYYDKSVLLATF